MPEKPADKLSFPLSDAQLREVRAISARIEAFGKLFISGFPRTSPGAVALIHKAEREKRRAQGLE